MELAVTHTEAVQLVAALTDMVNDNNKSFNDVVEYIIYTADALRGKGE